MTKKSKGTTPTIHVTARGGFWVDPKEIVESERGWELIEKVSRLRVDHGADLGIEDLSCSCRRQR